MTNFITTGELAELLDVSRTSIHSWRKQGIITPAQETPGGHAHWDPQQVNQQLKDKNIPLQVTIGEKGFTLIELLVVILIIGILLAIAAPAFLGQQDKAHDSEAKQTLAVAYKDATAEATQENPQGSFPSAAQLRSDIAAAEPQITVDDDADPEESELSVVSASGNNLEMSFLSKSGHLCTASVINGAGPNISCGEALAGGGDGGGDPPAATYVAAVTGDDPLSYYRLGDPDASVAADEVGGNDASYSGGSCTFGIQGIPGGSGDTGISSAGDCFLAINPVPALSNSFSVEYWYKSPYAFTQGLFQLSGPDGDNLWSYSGSCGGTPCIKVKAAATTGGYMEATMDHTNDDSWHQIVSTFSYDSGVTIIKMYRDGQLEFTEAIGVEFRTNSTVGELGRSPVNQDGADWNLWGDVDELSLYDSVLSDADVLNHYNLGMGL